MSKNKWKKAIISIILVITCLCSSITIYAQNEKKDEKHYNMMLVVDGSGSLLEEDGTDVDGHRYEAIDLFMGILADVGNRVGAVVFNDQLTLNTGLLEINGIEDKKDLSSKIKHTKVEKNTDIGNALEAAVHELQTGNVNKNLPSCIVLLSDGKTDLNSESAMEESLKKKADAVKKAKKAGIPIYGICLNANNSGNTDEVEKVSKATGGEFIEIQNSSDLEDAFMDFYSIIYGENVDGLEKPDMIGDKGYITKNFEIPDNGISEVNILVKCDDVSKAITLIQPDGSTIAKEDLQDMVMSTKKCDVIKIVSPDSGKWTVRVDGTKGASIRVGFVYNTDFSAKIECEEENLKDLPISSLITLKGFLMKNGKKITKDSYYEEYKGLLMIRNTKTNELKTYNMQEKGNHFVTKVKLDKEGSYTASIKLTSGRIVYTSQKTTIIVKNQAPTAKTNPIVKSFYRIPFVGKKIKINLNDYITDREKGSKGLTFKLGEYTYTDNHVSLEGNTLVVDTTGSKKGSIHIVATDADGKSSDIEFQVVSKGIFGFVALFLLIVVGIFALFKQFKKKKAKEVVCPLTITVESFDYDLNQSSNPLSITGFKYQADLNNWNIIPCGVHGNFRVEQISQGSMVSQRLYFESTKDFVTDDEKITNSLRLVPGDDIKLYSSSDRTSGVRIIVTDDQMY